MGGKKVCAWLLANCEVQLCSALAAMSLLGVVVVCPVMLDPAIETLASSFEDAHCRTVYSRSLQGMSNCTWSSCREGCTADIFSCWHIIVLYMTNKNIEIYRGEQSKQLQRESIEDSNNNNNNINNNNPNTNTNNNNNKRKSTNNKKLPTMPPSISRPEWSLGTTFNFNRDYDYDFTRNLTSGLNQMLGEIQGNIQNDTLMTQFIGIAALYPNQQKCVYPSDTVCKDFWEMYGKKGGNTFPCFVNLDNLTMVVTTVDKAGAIRNIFYCFIPLIVASAVFTYLFYRVGLIGDQRGRLKSDEESAGSGRPRPAHQGKLPNGGVPPNAPKKVRKKFLPNRKDSSKKRRARKNLKKNMSLKNQLSIKSASSSRRTPSVSMAGISDDVHVFSKQPRTSISYT